MQLKVLWENMELLIPAEATVPDTSMSFLGEEGSEAS